MDFQLNKNLGHWLSQLNDKTVGQIFQVDYHRVDRHEDDYLPWLFFITFADFDKFLEIEGDFDGDHIKISLNDNSGLENKPKENNLDPPDCWRVYDTNKDETLGRLLGQRIEVIEYGIDKDEFEINGAKIKGQKDVFNFISFNTESLKLTIFESLGLGVSDDPKVKLLFEDTFDRYKTQ